VLASGLQAVFCGINPGRFSAAAAAHFANPRNDFWRLLHDAGFTPRQLAPAEQQELLHYGYMGSPFFGLRVQISLPKRPWSPLRRG
jgi:G:T/U-mismatch repair DNA glycosylase